MLNCGELALVSRLWANNREVSREKCREDTILRDLYTVRGSPPRLGLGESCEDDDDLLMPVADKRQQQKRMEKKVSSAPTKVVRYNAQKESRDSFKFMKESFTAPAPVKSLLNITDVSALKRIEITVFAREERHTTDSPVVPLKVQVHEDATVLDVLQESLKLFERQTHTTMGDSPLAVVLHVAEEDGRPDDDLPALSTDQTIRKLGKVFCMMPRIRARRPSAREPTKVVKIKLPANEHMVVAYRPELKLKELLAQVCSRWNFDTTEHTFRLHESIVDVDGNITMRDLDTHTNGKNGLVLFKKDKSEIDSEMGPDTTPHLFKDKITVISYKQYDVWKIKSMFGKKQERLLGISGEMITNDNPRKRGATTKRPVHLIRDVKEVSLSDKKSTQFYVKVLDLKPYLYEAKSPELAREIVDKLQSCMHYANTKQ